MLLDGLAIQVEDSSRRLIEPREERSEDYRLCTMVASDRIGIEQRIAACLRQVADRPPEIMTEDDEKIFVLW